MAIQVALASFTGADPLDGGYPYVDVVYPVAYVNPTDYVAFPGLQATAPLSFWIKDGSQTTTGCRVQAIDQVVATLAVVLVDT